MAQTESAVAWARDGDGWIAVAPVALAASGGGLPVRASLTTLTAKVGDVPLGQWRGQLVLRDGRRLAIGGAEGCEPVVERGRLLLSGALIDRVEPALLPAARVELHFSATATCRP